MRRWLKVIGITILVALVVVGVVLFTPLTDPNLSSRPRPVGGYAKAVERIEAIKADEARQDLIPEGESVALLTGSRTATSVVIFHGYTSVPRQFQLVAEGYRAQGCNVWLPRLPYHGERDKMTSDFSKIDAALLRRFADENVDIANALGRDVIVIGFSGGGSLGVWSGSQRTDVDKTVLISPVLHPLGVPLWADKPLARGLRVAPFDVYKWWNPELKANNTEGYNYPRLSLGGLASMLSLTFWSDQKAAEGQRPAGEIVLIRNDGDQRLDSAYNEQFVKRLADPAQLTIYRIPKSAGLKHNFISPEPFSEGHDRIAVSYRYLSEALGIPLPDPLAAR